MSRPVHYTLGDQARRLLGPACVALGIALSSGPLLVDASRSGATSVTVTGGGLHLMDILLYVGIAFTTLGGILIAKDKPPDAAVDRFTRDGHVRCSPKHGHARIEKVLGKTKLFGPWIEIYATLAIEQPPRTLTTTFVVNESELRSFRAGERVRIYVDRDDEDEIAVSR